MMYPAVEHNGSLASMLDKEKVPFRRSMCSLSGKRLTESVQTSLYNVLFTVPIPCNYLSQRSVGLVGYTTAYHIQE